MFRYTFVIPFPANTPKGSFSVMTEWTGGVTVVFSCLTLVYVWKLRVNAELLNCRSVKHHNMPYTFLFDDAFIISTWFTPLKFDKEEDIFKVSISIAYLEVLGDIFTCTFIFMSTFEKTRHADTLVRSVSINAQWSIGVTLVFSSFTLVYVCKSRVNAELSIGFDFCVDSIPWG